MTGSAARSGVQPPSDDSRSDKTVATSPLGAIGRHPWLTALVLLVVAIVVLVLLWDWNWFKGPIERQVKARTGRSLHIGGDLAVDLGWVPTIRADDVQFGNAPWSKEPTMASARRVEFDIELRPLFKRKIRIPGLRLTAPSLRLETDAKGMGNWQFGSSDGMQPQFRRLWVDAGTLRFLDARNHTDIKIALASEQAAAADSRFTAPFTAKGGGRWHGNVFTVQGRAESPLELRDPNSPYRIDAHAVAGATRAHVRGTLLDPLRLADFNLKLALSGSNLEHLYPLIGIATPATPPYALDGQLTRDIDGKITVWHYDGFTGKVGDSDLAGSASVTNGGRRPYLRAKLVSKRLDFDDLAGFLGKAPTAGGNEATNPDLAAQAARESASARVLPASPYELDKLRAMDADVSLKAQRINSPKLPLDDMDAHLKLEAGVLRLDPLNFGVADGDIRSVIRMDARTATIHTNADIGAKGLNLAKLLPDVKLAQNAIGKVGGHLVLTGSGNSIAAMLGSSDGQVEVGMGNGRISNLLMEMAGIDLAEIIKFKLQGDRQIPVRCAFGDFGVKNGVMTTRSLAFDTTDTILIGDGTINLGDEKLDLTIKPRPKDRSLFALRSPLLVSGSFKHPSLRPDYKRVGLRAAIALTLGSIAAPAGLLATLELGPGKDSSCGGRYAK